MTSVSNLEDEKVYDLGPELLNMAAVDETHMELPVLGRSASQPTLGARYTRQDPSSNVSRPADVRHILHVEWDEELQAFTGVPDEWKDHLPQSLLKGPSEELPSHVRPHLNTVKRSSLCLPRSARPKQRGASEGVVVFSATSPASSNRKPRKDKASYKSASLPKDFRPARQPKKKAEYLSVREYLGSLGLRDMDRKYRSSELHQLLMSKLTMITGGASLIRLPYVLKIMVLSYLDVESLLSACATCTELHRLGENRLLWKPLSIHKCAQQRTLYLDLPRHVSNWKEVYRVADHLDKNPTYSDLCWNVVVTGDKALRKSRLVWSLRESAAKGKYRNWVSAGDDPVINPVSGIYRVGIDLAVRRVLVNTDILKLQVWDADALGGDPRSLSLARADVILILFDACSEESCQNLPQMVDRTRKRLDEQQADAVVLLFADIQQTVCSEDSDSSGLERKESPARRHRNLGDESPKERVMSYKDAKQYANTKGMVYLEGDASNLASVDAAFLQLAKECLNFSYWEKEGVGIPQVAPKRNKEACSIM